MPNPHSWMRVPISKKQMVKFVDDSTIDDSMSEDVDEQSISQQPYTKKTNT